jgi:hypothetical protein
VRKALQHAGFIIPRTPAALGLQERLDFALEDVLAGQSRVCRADFAVA